MPLEKTHLEPHKTWAMTKHTKMAPRHSANNTQYNDSQHNQYNDSQHNI